MLGALFVLSGCASGCRNTTEPVTAARGKVVWRVPITNVNDAAWMGTPAVEGNRAFFEINNTVTAFDVATGAQLWQTIVKSNPSHAAQNIIVRNGELYLAEASEVLSLDAATGAIRWRFTPDAQAALCESAVDDQSLYVGTRTHRVYALDTETGGTRWSTDIGADWQFFGIIKGISVSGDTVYAGAARYLNLAGGLSAGVIAALDRRDGRVLWTYQGPGTGENDVNSAPTVAGRLLVASDLGGAFFAVDRFTAQEQWRVNAPPGFFGPHAAPVVVGQQVYVGSNDAFVYSAELATGRVRWKTNIVGAIYAFTMCDNTAFAQNLGLFVLDGSSGGVVAQLYTDESEFPTSGFAVSGDRVLVSGTKAVYAIGC